MVIEGEVSGMRNALTPGLVYVTVDAPIGGTCSIPMTREDANAHRLGDKLRVTVETI